ncbi:MAG: hypothetical protein PHR68_02835 [Candidatus Gracilibacteria bacterium]|nr:hypothetical protein [Candidatus Gracilibacteria bacterium]
MECIICEDILNKEILNCNFNDGSNIITELTESFVETHNSSITEKSSTTYKITNHGEIVGYFVLSLNSFKKDSKNSIFFQQKNLLHEWYSSINLEYIVRKKGNNYKGIGDVMLNYISDIVEHIDKK